MELILFDLVCDTIGTGEGHTQRAFMEGKLWIAIVCIFVCVWLMKGVDELTWARIVGLLISTSIRNPTCM